MNGLKRAPIWCGLALLLGFVIGLADLQAQSSCPVPVNLFASDVRTRSANVSWDPQPGVFFYTVSVRELPNGAFVDDDARIFAPPYSLTGLKSDTEYQVRVRSNCATSGTSAWSVPVTFKTDREAEICPPPVLVTLGEVTPGSATLIWQIPLEARSALVSYRQLGRPNFTEIGDITRAPYTIENLRPNTSYEARVQHVCQRSISIFSNIVTFTTPDAPPCDPPSITVDNVGARTASIFWTPDFTNYIVEWRVQGVGPFLNTGGVGPTPYTLQNLLPSTTYEVRMRQVCGLTNSELSNLAVFTTTEDVPACQPPTVTVTNISDLTADVNWTPTDIDAYEVQYRRAGDVSWTVLNNSNPPPFTIQNLQPNTNYQLRFRKVCNTAFSDFAPVVTFRTLVEQNLCEVPAIQVSGVTNAAAVLTWTPGEARLRLEYRINGGAWLFLTDNGRSPNTFTGLSSGTRFEVRGQQICASRTSAFSTPVEFTTFETAPTCVGPTLSLVSVAETTATLNWTPTLQAYEIGFRRQGETDFTTLTGNLPPPFTLSGLVAGTNYDIRIRQQCGSEFSAFSNTVTARTTGGNNGGGGDNGGGGGNGGGGSNSGGNCGPPVLSSVGSTNGTITITWEGTLNNPEFFIRRVDEPDFQFAGTSTVKPFTFSGLEPNRSYRIRARHRCADTLTAFSNELTIATRDGTAPTCATPVLTNLSTTDASAVFSWTPSLQAFEIQWREAGGPWQSLQDQSAPPFTLLQLRPLVNYEARIRQRCGIVFSEFSNVVSFATQAEPPPGCPTPVLNVTNVEFDRVSLAWTAAGAQGNQYELSFRRAADPTWTVVPQTVSSPYTIFNLQRNTDYEVRVRLICPGGFSFYSNRATFRTPQDPPPCTPPNLSFSRVTDDAVTLQWTPFTQIYEVNLRRAGQTNWQISYSANPQPWRLEGLTPLTTYELRIRNACQLGFTAFSNTITFTTLPLQPVCAVPVSIRIDDLSDAAASVSWDTQTLVDSFEVYLSGNFGASYTKVATQKSNRYIFPGLAPNTTYVVRLRSICGTKFSEFSNTVPFTTKREASACAAPVNLNLIQLADRTATLSWARRLGVIYYDIERSTDGGQTWQPLSSITAPPIQLPGLQPQTNYQVRVRSACAGGLLSDWSEPIAFRTTADPLLCNTPDVSFDDVTPDAVRLNWTVPGTSFRIEYRQLGSSNWADNVRQASASPFNLIGLRSDTEYELRVRQECSGGRLSDWSTEIRFRTLPLPIVCPTPELRLDTVLTTTATLRWTPDAARVEVSFRRASEVDWRVAATNLTGGSYVLPDLVPGTAYVARVRRICGDNAFSPASNAVSFTTDAVPDPGCLAPTVQALQVTPTTATISWTPFMPNYEFSYRIRGSLVWITTPNTQPSPIFLNNLTPNELYEVRMRRLCANGAFSAWSNLVVFRTVAVMPDCPPPAAPQLVQLTNVSVELNWQTIANAEFYELSWSEDNGQTWRVRNNISQVPVTIEGLTPGREYLARLRHVCNGQFSAYSAVLRFTTFLDANGCPTPTPLVASQITESSAVITWPAATAGAVELSFRRTSESTWTVAGQNIAGVSFTLTGLSGNTDYVVRARRNCQGIFTPFSVTLAFRTAEPVVVCDAPVLQVDEVTNSGARLFWAPVQGLFQVNIREAGNPGWTLLPIVPTRSPLVLSDLVENRNYEVRIRQICTGGQTSEFSNIVSFRTAPPVFCPTPTLTISEVASDGATFSWTPSAEGYELRYRLTNSTAFVTLAGSDASSLRLTALSPTTRYAVQVRNRCNGNYSPWSAEQSFFTTPRPQEICDQPTLSLVDVAFNRARIDAEPGNQGLLFEWNFRPRGTGVWAIQYTMAVPPFTLFNLIPGAAYEVRMRYSCEDRFSPWSGVLVFTNPLAREAAAPAASAFELSVYPNPTRGRFTLTGPAETAAQLTLTDLRGRAVLRRNLPPAAEGRWSVELPEGIEPGLYLLRFAAGEQARSLRLIVE